MMARKDGVGQIIKAFVTVVTLVALTGGFRVIKTTLDDLFGLTRGAGDTVRPASFAYGLITLNLIDQLLDVDLQRWTPVRGWKMGSHQYTTSSNSTTLESNKSEPSNRLAIQIVFSSTSVRQCVSYGNYLLSTRRGYFVNGRSQRPQVSFRRCALALGSRWLDEHPR